MGEPVQVLEAFYDVWFRRDVIAVMAMISPVFRMTQHFDDPALPFTGTSVGRAAFQHRLEQIYADWRFLTAKKKYLQVDGERVRTNVTFDVQHLATGEVFDGTLRHFWVVRDGQLLHLDEHIDVERLKAFLRLLGLPSR